MTTETSKPDRLVAYPKTEHLRNFLLKEAEKQGISVSALLLSCAARQLGYKGTEE